MRILNSFPTYQYHSSSNCIRRRESTYCELHIALGHVRRHVRNFVLNKQIAANAGPTRFRGDFTSIAVDGLDEDGSARAQYHFDLS